ncbi:hypothetical protein F4818DRAFT_457772 [Hypoxylon cercidicola]|nr:hypothetical protein F4818DRAFT_457772 [Hypoxylon cercidicola]
MSSQPFPYQRRQPPSHATLGRPQLALATRSLGAIERRRSNTWTSSSGDPLLLYEGDQVDDRKEIIDSYNRLAKRYGIRQYVPGDFPSSENLSRPGRSRKGSWVSRAIRRTSSGHSIKTVIAQGEERHLQRRRSISDAALNLVHPRKDGLKNKNLEALVRLCGKSLFYLPLGYAPCSLVLPTCFRAVAQALVQHVETRGIFRIPGSIRVVNSLYDYYCADRDDSDNISTTTRCPDLPAHIKCGPHDIASAFKRFLAGLPGGILGSLSLFDALVAIHCQLDVGPEFSQTRQTKLRARLIALAIGSVKSQYQRELISAVFGLLCLIGRTAETAPREDENGRPLPTSDLMGYNALGIVFGPLLVNDLIDSYQMKLADPAAGLVLLPVSSPKPREERRKHRHVHGHGHRNGHGHGHKRLGTQSDDSAIDKIRIANSIAEMVIVHWREIVRQMRSLGTVKIRRHEAAAQHDTDRINVVSSASETYSSGKPPLSQGWDEPGPSHQQKDKNALPRVTTPTPSPNLSFSAKSQGRNGGQLEPLFMERRRSRPSISGASHKASARPSAACLSPTVEESLLATSVAQASRPTTVSMLRRSFESASNNPSLRRSPTGGESEAEGKTFKAEEYARNRDDIYPPHMRKHKSKNHDNSSSDHVVPGSEVTFYSARSSVTEIENHEEYLLQSGTFSSRAKEPVSLGEYSSKEPSISHASPAEKWEALSRASKASTESLSQSIKERRLKRSTDFESLRRSEEPPKTPEWKRLFRNKRSEEKLMKQPARLSPERKSRFENYALSGPYGAMGSPRKSKTGSGSLDKSAIGEGNDPVSQRSSPKPVGGVVKAMAALFKGPARDASASPTVTLTGGTDRSSAETGCFQFPYSRSASTSKPGRSGASLAASSQPKASGSSQSRIQLDTPTRSGGFASSVNYSNASPASSSRATLKDALNRPPPVSLRPTGSTHAASRKLPLGSSTQQVPQHDREVSQPLSLGTMTAHIEEPPVAQHMTFMRPPQGTYDASEHEQASSADPQCRGSNSMLHAQIRFLQRQLEARTEECTQLRRQLEACNETDIGKICEQLREARRERKMWRDRAETAERRVAVFEHFTARLRGLRTSALEEAGLPAPAAVDGQLDGLNTGAGTGGRSSSESTSCSERTENWEELRDRVRQSIKRHSMKEQSATNSGGSRAEDWDEDGRSSQTKGKGKGKDKGLRKKPAPDDWTAQLWAITEELLVLDGRVEGESED